jgi:hypothetical protein
MVVTIDTEEDQWGPSEGRPSAVNLLSLPRLQSLFDRYGIVPTYLVNYVVASDGEASQILMEICDKGRCEIGTHLHPWNTPPLLEELTNRNSMLGNLPYEMQLEKIGFATDFLSKKFQVKPTSFRAGRWGLGKDTIKALISCGYRVDTSATPFVSWESSEGPSFVTVPSEPYFVDSMGNICSGMANDKLLEVPATIGYSRWPFYKWHCAYELLERFPSRLRAKGLASRLGLLRQVWLSPEQESTANMLLLSRILISRGIKVLNLFFHSNSLVPGLNPFVSTEADLKEFYSRIAAYFEDLLGLADVMPLRLSQVRELVDGELHEPQGELHSLHA